MAEYQRPQIPYTPEASLPYNNRYGLIASNNQPPTAQQLDGDINYLIDCANALFKLIQDVTAGVIPGSNVEVNADKFPTTDGKGNITYVFAQQQNIDDNAVGTNEIQDGAITADKLGAGSVATDKIYPGAVGANQIANGAVSTTQLANNAVTSDKIAVEAIETAQIANHAVTAAKIANNTITSAQIANSAIGTTQIANQAITRPLLASILQLPIGMIVDFAGTTMPTGWLSCIGQEVSRTTYETLFGVIGTTYGAGDGSATFNLPDFRGRVAVGLDSAQANNNASTNNLVTTTTADKLSNGGIGGAETITLAQNQIPSHTHNYNQASGTGGVGNGEGGTIVYFKNTQQQTTSTGDGQAHPNMPPYLFVGKIIYAGDLNES